MKYLIFTLLILSFYSCNKENQIINENLTKKTKIDLSGRWKFERSVYDRFGKYVEEQYNQIEQSDLIITDSSCYFQPEIDFIDNC